MEACLNRPHYGSLLELFASWYMHMTNDTWRRKRDNMFRVTIITEKAYNTQCSQTIQCSTTDAVCTPAPKLCKCQPDYYFDISTNACKQGMEQLNALRGIDK